MIGLRTFFNFTSMRGIKNNTATVAKIDLFDPNERIYSLLTKHHEKWC